MIVAHVVGIFQHVAGEHGDHGFIGANFARRDELANSGDRGGGGGLAADAVASDDGFGVGDFLLADGDDAAVRTENCAQRLSATKLERQFLWPWRECAGCWT